MGTGSEIEIESTDRRDVRRLNLVFPPDRQQFRPQRGVERLKRQLLEVEAVNETLAVQERSPLKVEY